MKKSCYAITERIHTFLNEFNAISAFNSDLKMSISIYDKLNIYRKSSPLMSHVSMKGRQR